MRTIETIAELRSALGLARSQKKQIGFVPTMGALHEGHLSLVRLSKQQTDLTVVSIFVNPTQFGPNEDFSKYPRTLDSDTSMLVDAEVDFLFLPDAKEMYPDGHATSIHVGVIGRMFEGAIRPGHFNGVATVVSALFNIVQPDIAFFGQKDAQQIAVIRQMVRDLHIPVEIAVGPTVREADGLALSSRNRYLSADHRAESVALWKTLVVTSETLKTARDLHAAVREGIATFQEHAPHGSLDYIAFVDSETFQPVDSFESVNASAHAWSGSPPALVIAARIGETRLIDNISVE